MSISVNKYPKFGKPVFRLNCYRAVILKCIYLIPPSLYYPHPGFINYRVALGRLLLKSRIGERKGEKLILISNR